MSLKTIKIFLASSAELKADRDAIRMFISVENDSLIAKGYYLQLVQWEYFFDAISDTRLQDEYNKALMGCDIVLSLFFTKAGKYTQEEFEKALETFKRTGKPRIFTYFKHAEVNMASLNKQVLSLFEFKDRLSELGHFPSSYSNIDDFKLQFRKQLEMYMESEAAAGKDETSVSQTHSGSGDNVAGDKIGVQVNVGARNPEAPNPNSALKVLFLASNPTDMARIQTGKEFKLIRNAVNAGTQRDRLLLEQSENDVTIQEMVKALGKRPNIVHFSGHGGLSGIYVTGPQGESTLVPVAALKLLFSQLEGVTLLVVLNACYSTEQAPEISRYGMYVIGYNQPIEDTAATGFAEGLYIGLAEGKPFENAFRDGKVILMVHDPVAANSLEVWKDGEKLFL